MSTGRAAAEVESSPISLERALGGLALERDSSRPGWAMLVPADSTIALNQTTRPS